MCVIDIMNNSLTGSIRLCLNSHAHRARSYRSASAESGAPCSYHEADEERGSYDVESATGMDFYDPDADDYDDDDERSLYGTQCTMCSCTECTEMPKQNPIFGRNELRMSFCER